MLGKLIEGTDILIPGTHEHGALQEPDSGKNPKNRDMALGYSSGHSRVLT